MTTPRVVAPVFLLALLACFVSAATSAEIELTSPAGGEKWAIGSGHAISWKTATLPAAAMLKVELSNDGGKTWAAATTVPNSGSYLWTIPDGTPATVQIRVAAASGEPSAPRQVSIIPSQAVQYEWKKITMTAAWAPRDGAGALVYKDALWLIGGWNPDPKYRQQFFPRICNNEVWTSKNGADWTQVKVNSFKDDTFNAEADWEGRHTAGYVVHKDKMWIVGGDCNQHHYHFDVWNSDNGKDWTYVNKGKPVPWGPRCLHYTVAFKDKIWVMGGQTVPQFAPAEQHYHRDVWNSSDGVEWTKLEPKEPFWPQRGMIGGGVVFNDRIWILGGGTYDTPTINSRKFMNDVWSSADGVSWTQHTEAAPWTPRQYHDVGVFDGRMWVMEGYHVSSGNRKDVWYSQDGVNWYEVPNTPWKPRHAAGIYTYDGGIWMIGGNNMEPDAWKLVPVAKK
jgi:hypothetical protein